MIPGVRAPVNLRSGISEALDFSELTFPKLSRSQSLRDLAHSSVVKKQKTITSVDIGDFTAPHSSGDFVNQSESSMPSGEPVGAKSLASSLHHVEVPEEVQDFFKYTANFQPEYLTVDHSSRLVQIRTS